MNPEASRLVAPAVAWEEAFREMAEEFRAAGERFHADVYGEIATHFAAYVRRLKRYDQGRGIATGMVPYATYWLTTEDGRIVGECRLRYRLTPGLLHEGGHIGYGIRPSARRQGFGTRILALTLEKAREHGIRQTLVTCDTDNIGSARIIERNGGVLENEVISRHSGKPVSRYWIDLE